MERRGGCLWLLVGLFLALIAGGLAFTVMLRATSAESPGEASEPRAPVVIISQDVPPRTELTAEDLITKEVPISAIPENAVRDQASAIGQIAVSQLVAGEILLKPRIAAPGEQTYFEIKSGQVIMAFPAEDLMSQAGVLQPGDIVDILYTIPPTTESEENVTFWTLQQVPIKAIVVPGQAQGGGSGKQPSSSTTRSSLPGAQSSILLALDPQDALLLKHLKDTDGTIVDIVLRGREDDTEFETEPVDPMYLQERFKLK